MKHPALRAAALWLTLLAAPGPVVRAGAPSLDKQILFEEGTGGFFVYRIPGIVVTAHGTVLAYCEGRKFTGMDWGEIEVHLRRSTDGGRTFDAQHQIAHLGPRLPRNPVISNRPAAEKVGGPGEQTVNNPVAIADRDGTVHLLYCVEYMRCFYLRSTDDGVTWSKPIEITSTFERFRPEWPWRVVAIGPGHGIQLSTGRLVAPVWIATSDRSPHSGGVATTIYSDDRGATWQRGQIVVRNDSVIPGASENIAAELSDGRVMLLVRTRAKANRKIVCFSPDGATGWSQPEFVDALLEGVCMASLVRYPGSDRPRLLFSNPDTLDPEVPGGKAAPGDRRARKNVSVKLSCDDGRTWPVSKVLEAGPSSYSDMAVLPDGGVLCFYESGRPGRTSPYSPGKSWSYAYLKLARFNLEWLTNGADTTPGSAPPAKRNQ